MDGSGPFPVKLYVYELTKGFARSMSMSFLGKQIDGVWHTGTVVYGEEYYFGGIGGIESCPPCGTILGQPDTIIDMGTTQVPKEMFLEFLAQLATSKFRPQDYKLFEHNCNNFSDEVCQFLTGKSIPSHITGLPSEVLNTPLGAMIKPLIDSMNIQPSGGHSVFPSQAISDTTSAHRPSSVTDAQLPSQSPIQTNIPKPITIKADIRYVDLIGDEVQGSIKSAFSHGDLNLWNEAVEYLQTSNPSWSLSKMHIYIIGKILCCKEIKVKDIAWKSTCEILQNLLLVDDVITVLIHTSVHILLDIFSFYGSATLQQRFYILPIIINLCGNKLMWNILFGEKKDTILHYQSMEICCNGLLDDSLNSKANLLYANLAFNIITAQKDNDVDIEIGSAVTTALQQPNIDNDTAICLLSSLLQIMERNDQMQCLVSVMGYEWPHLEKLSQNCKDLYMSVKASCKDAIY